MQLQVRNDVMSIRGFPNAVSVAVPLIGLVYIFLCNLVLKTAAIALHEFTMEFRNVFLATSHEFVFHIAVRDVPVIPVTKIEIPEILESSTHHREIVQLFVYLSEIFFIVAF